MRNWVGPALLCIGLLAPAPSHASPLLASPSPPGPPHDVTLSLDVTVDQARYQYPGDRFAVDRTIYSSTWAYESFYASVGYIASTEFDDLENFTIEGRPGYVLALGARGAAWRRGEYRIDVHGQLDVMNEKFIYGGVNGEMQSRELLLGATGTWARDGWRLYAGAQVMPLTDIDMDIAALEDIERSDFVFLYAGVGMAAGPVALDLEGRFQGSTGVRIGIAFAF
jgi:hypothetical protein